MDEEFSGSKRTSFNYFNQLLLSKGVLFTVLFYVLVLFVIIQLIFGILFNFNVNGFIIFILLSYLVYKLVKLDLFSVLVITFLFSFFGMGLFGIAPLLQGLLGISNVTFYPLIIVYSLVLGLIMSFMFGKVVSNFKKYFFTFLLFSVVISFLFGLNSVVGSVIDGLEIPEHDDSEYGGYILGHFGAELFNPIVGFALALLFFNLPFLVSTYNFMNNNPTYYLLYILPIIVFTMTLLIMNNVANLILNLLK